MTRSATESFQIGNVAPQAAIIVDFAGGALGDTVDAEVKIQDSNTLAGARLTVCIHRATASCAADNANGIDIVRWNLDVTDAAPSLVADAGNGDWSLALRSHTGDAYTTTATYGFDVRIGMDTQVASDWVIETTTTDELAASVTVAGAPAAISAPQSRTSGFSFGRLVSSLWPF